jgi:MobA-like NTP transferase domain
MASVCRPIVVVLGSCAEELKKHLIGLPVTAVANDQWANGMGTSIRWGVSAIGSVDAVMIFLCDQPLVTAQSLDQMVHAHFSSGKKITAALYATKRTESNMTGGASIELVGVSLSATTSPLPFVDTCQLGQVFFCFPAKRGFVSITRCIVLSIYPIPSRCGLRKDQTRINASGCRQAIAMNARSNE